MKNGFIKAIPVWTDGSAETLMNTRLVFTARLGIEADDTLKIAAFDFYRLTVNGRFVGFGPARAAKNHARIDVYDLSEFQSENCEIIIDVAGYACRSLSTCAQPSMLCAEITRGEKVLAATGFDGFECRYNAAHEQITERYSVQRHFCEQYDYSRTVGAPADVVPVKSDIKFLPRGVNAPDYTVLSLDKITRRGTYKYDINKEKARHNAYSFNPFDENFGAFPRETVSEHPYGYISHTVTEVTDGGANFPVSLQVSQWCRFDFPQVEVGFLRAELTASENTELFIAFTEYCPEEGFAFGTSMNAQNVIVLKIPAGKSVDFESFEPYSCQTAAVFVRSGAISVSGFGVRSFVCDTSAVKIPEYSDGDLTKIYRTALRTYSHNAVDIFTDCPSRERAGWLCDSYFTAKAEYFFFGDSKVETNFLENFLLFENEDYPRGVIPMVYPADAHQNNKFIPQWAMWFILEVREYMTERKPQIDKERFRKIIMDYLEFLAQYENSDGLLERLPSWNFIEWSDANKWGHDVNFPTNFLYSAVLDAAADLFGDNTLHTKAENVRAEARRQSFNGELFADRACRDENGVLVRRDDISEACQYYACLFGGVNIDDEKYARLRHHIKTNFAEYTAPLCRINAFIGLYLRMDLLDRLGWSDVLLRDLKYFYLPMCDKTGTLWEYRDCRIGSLDHGFASYIATVLPRG